MNKRLSAFIVFLVIAVTDSVLYASDAKYFRINYGVGIANKINYGTDLPLKSPKNSQAFSLALGYNFYKKNRVELELNNFKNFKYENSIYQSNTNFYYKQNIKLNTLVGNVYFDINDYKPFIPYINIGIGVSRNKTSDVNCTVNGETVVYYKKNSKNNFIWNIGGGISYNLNDRINLDLINYKYYNLGKISTENNKEGDILKGALKINSISTGMSINFNIN